MVKKLDLGAINKRVKGDMPADTAPTATYNEAPDYLERRMERQSEIVKGKRERRTLYRIDPSVCRIWKHHDRDYAQLNEENCADLIEGFKSSGQIIPATVRPIDDKHYQYEICAGARRHWAAVYLGMDLIIEIRDLSDEEMFLFSDEENRNRQDISDYERALKYQRALQAHYKNQTQMATRMGVTKDWLSRYLDLAKLDEDIVKAYESLNAIKTRHVRELKPIMQTKKMLEKVIHEAKRMHTEPQPGPVVIKRLKAAAKQSTKKTPREAQTIVLSSINDKPFATMMPIKNKTLTIQFDLAASTSLDDWQAAVHSAWEKQQSS